VRGVLEYGGMSVGALITVVAVAVILGDIALLHSEILWHRPDKRARVERLEGKVMLVLAAACIPAIAYALARGRLWPAAACALCAFSVLSSYRRNKQMLDREP
jgi:hypothetical protein